MSIQKKDCLSFLIFILLFFYPVFTQVGLCEEGEETIEEEIIKLQDKLMEVEESIANLSLGINIVRENLTVFLMKEDKEFDITFLELLVNGASKYKQILSDADNKFLDDSKIGKKITKLFWGSLKRGRVVFQIRCFYRLRNDKSKKEYKIVRDFKISRKKKISNILSVRIKTRENEDDENQSDFDIDINIAFW